MELLLKSHLEMLNNFTSRMEAAMKEAHSALMNAANNMTPFYDAHHHREALLYAVRDKVWLNGKNTTTTHPMKKLYHKWLGPYSVEKFVSQSAYQLKLPLSFCCIHPIFSVTFLRPYNSNTIAEHVQQDHPHP